MSPDRFDVLGRLALHREAFAAPVSPSYEAAVGDLAAWLLGEDPSDDLRAVLDTLAR